MLITNNISTTITSNISTTITCNISTTVTSNISTTITSNISTTITSNISVRGITGYLYISAWATYTQKSMSSKIRLTAVIITNEISLIFKATLSYKIYTHLPHVHVNYSSEVFILEDEKRKQKPAKLLLTAIGDCIWTAVACPINNGD